MIQPDRTAGGQGRGHARRPGRFGPDHADTGSVFLEPHGDAGDQATAPDGHDDGAHAGTALLAQFHPHCSLSGDGAHVVEGVHVDRAGGCGIVEGGGAGLVVVGSGQHQVDPGAPDGDDAVPLLAWRGSGDEHLAVDAQRSAAERHPLCMVAGAGAGHTETLLGRGERADQVVRPTDLVRAPDLEVLALQPDVGVQDFGEPLTALDRCLSHDRAQRLGGCGDSGSGELRGCGHASMVRRVGPGSPTRAEPTVLVARGVMGRPWS